MPTEFPRSRYIDLRLPSGKHSGLRLDPVRMVLELQREGIKYYFDLAMMYNPEKRIGQEDTNGVDNRAANKGRVILGI